MNPLLIALAGLAALALQQSPGGYGAGSTRVTLRPGTYRLRFKSAKPQTNSLQDVWAIPHVLMNGTGLQSRFESMTVDQDPNFWWFTALSSYTGPDREIDLLPSMTLDRLS